MPSIVSSCSTVALPRLIGPSSARRRRRRGAPPGPALGHDDLLAVGEAGGAVDRLQQRAAAGAAGALDRVRHPRPGRQPVDAGPPHRAGDVDDDVGPPPLLTLKLAARRAEVAAAAADRRRAAAALGPDRPRADEQQGDGDGAVDEHLGAAQLGHAPKRCAGRGARVARSTRTIRLQTV